MDAMIDIELELQDISFSNLAYINELRGMIAVVLIGQLCNYPEFFVEGFDKKEKKRNITCYSIKF